MYLIMSTIFNWVRKKQVFEENNNHNNNSNNNENNNDNDKMFLTVLDKASMTKDLERYMFLQ